jgi:hypothetical protein
MSRPGADGGREQDKDGADMDAAAVSQDKFLHFRSP